MKSDCMVFSNVTLCIFAPLSQTPSQQAAMLDNDQEGVTGSNQWAPYSLGRRDVPPDNLMKKVGAVVSVLTEFEDVFFVIRARFHGLLF